MRMIVTRVLAVFFLLAIVTYLLPERQDTAANEPDNQNARAVRSSSAPMPKDLKIVENISYRQGNKKAWKLDLIMPRERGETKRPALVFVHGGGWSGGDKTQGMLNSGPIDYARKGYVCISVNYRLTREAPFPACLEDVKCSVRWLRAHAENIMSIPIESAVMAILPARILSVCWGWWKRIEPGRRWPVGKINRVC